MTRTTALVLSISLLLLGGAWMLSRMLTADVPVPAVSPNVDQPRPPSFEPGVVTPPRPPLPGVVKEVSSPPPEPEGVAVPPPAVPPQPVEALSPEQVEIDGIASQGEQQLKDERGGPANWKRAEKFFVRCLTIAPEEQRCKDGLQQARVRIGPKVVRPTGPLVPVQDPPPPDPEE